MDSVFCALSIGQYTVFLFSAFPFLRNVHPSELWLRESKKLLIELTVNCSSSCKLLCPQLKKADDKSDLCP